MLRHKNIDRVCCIVLALTLMLTCVYMGAAASGVIQGDRTIGYENRLFDQSKVHTIDIVMDNWEAFLETCTSEEYSVCSIVIDGEAYSNVGIRGKGNTSLSSVASYGNNRYSFKVEFDQYQSGASYHGLDKLSLNNLIQDNTYLKDYTAYTLMNKMGVAAPLCSFVRINVNGEYWGLYLAVEGVEDSFLQRNYGTDHGELYKPDSMSFGGGRGNGMDFDMDEIIERFSSGEESTSEDETSGFAQMTPFANFNMANMRGRASEEVAPEAMETSETAVSEATTQAGETAAPETTAEPSEAPDSSSAFSGNAAAVPAQGEMPTGFDPSQTGGNMQMPQGGFDPARMTEQTGELSEGMQIPEGMEPPEDFDPSQFEDANFSRGGFGGENMGGGFGMGSDDVKLKYIDDDPSSYFNIFNNAKTDISAADQNRLIESLKSLSEGDLSVVDKEAVLRYLAVHNFLCNGDSYTGTMVHNYYIYEEHGVLSMIPWDYNLAFGGFDGGSNASSTVNSAIDDVVSSGEASDRPMVGWVVGSEEDLARYHEIYASFMDEVFNSGWFAEELQRVIDMIAPYVESDPTAFCSYEEFQAGAAALLAFCEKRAESVNGQLDGSIPSTSDAQRSSEALVDASDVDISAMGSMGNMGGGNMNRGGFSRDSFRRGETSDAASENTAEVDPIAAAGEAQMQNMPSGSFGGMSAGQMPQTDAQLQAGAADMSQETSQGAAPQGIPSEASDATQDAPSQASEVPQDTASEAPGSAQPQEGRQEASNAIPGSFSMEFRSMQASGSGSNAWILYTASAAVLLVGLLVAARFRGQQ